MKLKLVAVGTRLDDWINAGYEEYARRLPRDTPLSLQEVPVGRRGRDRAGRLAEEGTALLSKVDNRDHVVALDVRGRRLDTEALAGRLEHWRMSGKDVAFLVGGADGLASDALARADERLSLSDLTLPHGLVRIVLAEQLYRAWTLLAGHPYHRA